MAENGTDRPSPTTARTTSARRTQQPREDDILVSWSQAFRRATRFLLPSTLQHSFQRLCEGKVLFKTLPTYVGRNSLPPPLLVSARPTPTAGACCSSGPAAGRPDGPFFSPPLLSFFLSSLPPPFTKTSRGTKNTCLQKVRCHCFPRGAQKNQNKKQ
jgi:hypothetical protein